MQTTVENGRNGEAAQSLARAENESRSDNIRSRLLLKVSAERYRRKSEIEVML